MRGSNGEPLYFTKQNVTDNLGYEEAKKVEVFETLDKTYSEEQVTVTFLKEFIQIIN